MSTEMKLFRDSNVMINTERELDDVTKRLLGSGNYRRISIKGGKFRMIVNGQQTAVSHEPAIEVVVVNAAPHVGRNYYAKTYDPNNVESPDCWSNDGITPDKRSRNLQAKTCDSCPKNIAGSGKNNSRACRYLRRLAVVLGNNIMESDVYQLQAPATSIFGKGTTEAMPLDAYVKHLAGFRFPITSVVTEIRFDQESESPKLYFKAVRPLTSDEREVVATLKDNPETLAAITFDPATIDTKAREEERATTPSAEREATPRNVSEPTLRPAKAPTVPAPTNESPAKVLAEWGDDE